MSAGPKDVVAVDEHGGLVSVGHVLNDESAQRIRVLAENLGWTVVGTARAMSKAALEQETRPAKTAGGRPLSARATVRQQDFPGWPEFDRRLEETSRLLAIMFTDTRDFSEVPGPSRDRLAVLSVRTGLIRDRIRAAGTDARSPGDRDSR